MHREMPLYEAHIAIPTMNAVKTDSVITGLKSIGIRNIDYFLRLINVPIDKQPCPIDPSTHDIRSPMLITTIHAERWKIITLILDGMKVLESHGVHTGNFELECDAHDNVMPDPTIDDFAGFRQQEGSPKYEAHIQWEGKAKELPSDEEIIDYHRSMFGYSPNQIADFALQIEPPENEVLWRVSTVYHASSIHVLKFYDDAMSKMHHMAQFVSAEKICVVSEPMEDGHDV